MEKIKAKWKNHLRLKREAGTVETVRTESRNVVEYCVYMILLLLLARGRVAEFAPFAVAFFAALIYLKKNPVVCAVLFVSASLIVDPSVFTAITQITCAICLMTTGFVLNRLKTELNMLWYAAFVLLSRVCYLTYYVDVTSQEVAFRLIETALMLVFLFAFLNGMRAVLVRGLRFRVTVDEVVSLCCLAAALYQGVFGMRIFGVDVSVTVGILLILLASRVFGGGGAAAVGAVLGLAGLVYDGNLVSVAVFTVYGLTAAIFKDMHKILSAMAVLLVFLLFGYYFQVFGVLDEWDIVAAAIPCVVFPLLPERFFNWCLDLLGGVNDHTLSRYIVNRNRQDVSNRLYELSGVFREMQVMYGKLVAGASDETQMLTKLCAELQCKTCEGCGEEGKCWYKYKDTMRECFRSLMETGVRKGKIGLVDMDEFLTGKCVRVGSLMSAANQLIYVQKQNRIVADNLDAGKLMISRQMGGISKVMENLAQSVHQKAVFNLELEKNIIDELAFGGVVCNEVIVYGEDYMSMCVSVVVREKDAANPCIFETATKVCGMKMMVVSREDSGRKGWAVVYLKPMPKYDMVFGAAGCKKTGSAKSGDTHSLIRIAEDRFMLCLCDGMGSGEKAEEISNAAISLVESFYRAGFENDVILGSVNKMLAYIGEEVFAAIDIAVVNLKDGKADFIKIGAPESFVKSKNGAVVVEGSSLPLGILEDVQPWTVNRELHTGEMVVLATDGIREAFGEQAALQEFLERETTLNPQTLADHLVEEAIRLQDGKSGDDMTVIVSKLFTK